MIYTQTAYYSKTAIPKKEKGVERLIAKRILREKTKGGEKVNVTSWDVAYLDKELMSRIPKIEQHLKDINDFALFYGARFRPTDIIHREQLNDLGTRAKLISWANGRPRIINGITFDEMGIVEEWARNGDLVKNGLNPIEHFSRSVIEWYNTTDFNDRVKFLQRRKDANFLYGMQYANGGRYFENPDIIFSIVLGKSVSNREEFARAMGELSIDTGLQSGLLEVYDAIQRNLIETLASYELYRTEDFGSLVGFTDKEKRFAVDDYFFLYDNYHAKKQRATKNDTEEANEIWEDNRVNLIVEYDNHQVKSNVMKELGIPPEYVITPKKRKVPGNKEETKTETDTERVGRYSYPREIQRTFQTELSIGQTLLHDENQVQLIVGMKDQRGHIIERNDFVRASHRNVEDFKLTKKVMHMITSRPGFDAEEMQNLIEDAVNSETPDVELTNIQSKLTFQIDIRELSQYLHPTKGSKSNTINCLIARVENLPYETYIYHRNDGGFAAFTAKDFILLNATTTSSKRGTRITIMCSPSLFDHIKDNYIPMDDNYMRFIESFRENDKIRPATLIILETEWKKAHAIARREAKEQKRNGVQLLDANGKVIRDLDGSKKKRRATKNELQTTEERKLVSMISIPNFINVVMFNCGASYEDTQKKSNRQKYGNKIKEIVERMKNDGILIDDYIITKDNIGDTSFKIWWK